MSEARETTARFLETADRQHAAVIHLPLERAEADCGPSSVAIAWLGSFHARRLLVHISGVHGVEGLAGALVQTELLRRAPRLAAGVAAVWIHGVNRFGMEQLRRTNRLNVDLNRNCLENPEYYRGNDPLYGKLAWLVLPGRRRHSRPFGWFLARILVWAVRYGIGPLAQAIAAGQYEYPTGLFYGGNGLAEETALLLSWAEEHLSGRTVIGLIDFHTGLGRFGRSLVLGDTVISGRDQGVRATPATGGNHRPAQAAYAARGELVAALARRCQATFVRRCTHEVGTYAMARVLWVLSEENHFWHQHPDGPQSALWRKRLKHVFVPAHSSWRKALIQESEKVWRKWLDWASTS
ncbi:MAG: hypothetical protein KatS3mg110_4312 [Pirellulaceae bacterium]|nr:MAG: hypothetical protein KatS3mg110_4312 [Pirellulaceae bacterium]